jgi:hypothetical protein
LKTIIQWLVSIALFALFGWSFVDQIQAYSDDLNRIKDDAFALWPAFAFVMTMFFIAMLVRAHRWALTLGQPSQLWTCYRSIAIGYLIQCPLSKLGEVARIANQHKVGKNPMGQILSTVFVDRILDVFFMGIVLITCLSFEQDRISASFPDLKTILPKLTLLAILGFTAAVVFVLLKDKLVTWVQKASFLPVGLKHSLEHFLIQLNQGFEQCRSIKMIGYLLGSNLFIWLTYYVCFYCSVALFPQLSELTYWDIFTVFTIATIGVLIPVPGGMAYPLFTKGGLLMVAPSLDPAIAFSISLILYCFNFWFVNLICGGAAWLWQAFGSKEKTHA